jgi:hypothetical protein
MHATFLDLLSRFLSGASAITKKMIGVVTVAGSPVGRRNRLHVPHEAAASVTMNRPASTCARTLEHQSV